MAAPRSTGVTSIIVALLLAEVTASFESTSIYAAFNHLIAAFGDPAKAGWLITTYLLVAAVSSALGGRLGDLYGRRRLMLMLLAVAGAGSLLSASTTNFVLILVGRALQGLTGGVLALSIGLLQEALPSKRVAMGVGIVTSGASVGAAIGLVGGGAIVDYLSWRGIFLASAALTVLAYVAVLACVPSSPRRPVGRPDWLGGLLFTASVMALMIVVSNAKAWGWTGWRPLSCLLAGAALFAVWVRRSLTIADPMIEVRLLRNREIRLTNVISALVALGAMQITLIFSTLLQAPIWTGVGMGLTATAAGLVKLPSNGGAVLAGPLSGHITERWGGRSSVIAGGLITTLGWVAAAFFHRSIAAIALSLCAISFGLTMLLAAFPNVIVTSAPANRTSEAAGVMALIRSVAAAIGAQIFTALLATDTVHAPHGSANYPTERAFNLTMAVVVVLCLAATLLALRLPSRRVKLANTVVQSELPEADTSAALGGDGPSRRSA